MILCLIWLLFGCQYTRNDLLYENGTTNSTHCALLTSSLPLPALSTDSLHTGRLPLAWFSHLSAKHQVIVIQKSECANMLYSYQRSQQRASQRHSQVIAVNTGTTPRSTLHQDQVPLFTQPSNPSQVVSRHSSSAVHQHIHI